MTNIEFVKALRDMTLFIPLTASNIRNLVVPCKLMQMNRKVSTDFHIWKFTNLHLVNIETDDCKYFDVKNIKVGKQPPIDDMLFFVVKFE